MIAIDSKKEIRLFTPVRAFYTSKIYTFHWHSVLLGVINTVLLGSSIDSGVIQGRHKGFLPPYELFTP